jgi:hypothetical protein
VKRSRGARLDPGASTNQSVWLTNRRRKGRGNARDILSHWHSNRFKRSPVTDTGGSTTKIVVIGSTGLIGSKTVAILRRIPPRAGCGRRSRISADGAMRLF